MKKNKPSNNSASYEFSLLNFDVDNQKQFREEITKVARVKLKEFPVLVEQFLDLFRSIYPAQILACLSSYALRQYAGSNGVEPRSSLNEFGQHHLEFLQALLLTLPDFEWGQQSITPEIVQKMFDLVPELSIVALSESIVSTPENLDKDELAIRGLQQRLKFHTQGVRNWGYFDDVVRLSNELILPLNNEFEKYYGFSGEDLIRVLKSIVSEFEDRQNKHFNVLRKISRGKNYRQIIRNYYKYAPDLGGSADDLIEKLPKDCSREQALGLVMAHFDLELDELATFHSCEIARISDVSEVKILAIMAEVTYLPGDLEGSKIEHFFLGNPVWDRPAIALGNKNYFFAAPQIAFSHISRLIDRLASKANLKKSLEKQRSKFLENHLVSLTQKALPGAMVRSSVMWEYASKHYETDLLVIHDRVVLIGEAKSHRLTPEGLRGAPKRVKRHITDLIISPSLQSARLEKLIYNAKDGDESAWKAVKDIGINPELVDCVIRFSVTLDDLSALSTAEKEFKVSGWLPEDHQLAPSILISDFDCIVNILDNPILFYHYLKERYYFQKSFQLLGDELDFLGLYLDSCFNLSELEKLNAKFVPSGMSASIDRYFESRGLGITIPKPKVSLGNHFRKVLNQLAVSKPGGWTTVGMHILSCADPREQKKIDREVVKMKGLVRREYRDPKHLCTIIVCPPEARKALVVFHFFPRQLKNSNTEKNPSVD